MGARLKILCVITIAAFSVPVFAEISEDLEETQHHRVLIVELMTGSDDSASDEFVELYNESDDPLPAKNLKLQYKPASGDDWTTKAALEGTLQPRGRYLIATKSLTLSTDADTLRSTLGLAGSGGHIRLVGEGEGIPYEYDAVSWGDAESAQAEPMTAPPAGSSIKRVLDEDGAFIDTDNDYEDFILSNSPTPQRSQPLPEEGIEADERGTTSQENREYVQGSNQNSEARENDRTGPFLPLTITELMPDPDKPLTDAEDEFVELFNPHDSSVDIEDYVIETGTNYSYRFTLPNITLKSGEYIAFYSLDTNLTLSNSEGQARLLAPNGDVVYETAPYSGADPNMAWALIGEQWQWTSQPTPSQANVAAGDSDERSGGNSTVAGVSSGRASNYGNLSGRTVYEEPPASDSKETDTAVVAGVGSLALLYAGYEYRYDIGNRIAQARRYLSTRRSSR